MAEYKLTALASKHPGLITITIDAKRDDGTDLLSGFKQEIACEEADLAVCNKRIKDIAQGIVSRKITEEKSKLKSEIAANLNKMLDVSDTHKGKIVAVINDSSNASNVAKFEAYDAREALLFTETIGFHCESADKNECLQNIKDRIKDCIATWTKQQNSKLSQAATALIDIVVPVSTAVDAEG